MLNQYTIDEMEIEIQSRKTKEVYTNYLAIAIDEIPIKAFINSLCIHKGDRDTIYAGESKIALVIKQNKVIPTLAGVQLKGAKRTAVFQMIMHHSRILTNSKGYGNESPMYSNTQTVFDTYTVEWNSKRYTIGFIQKEEWDTHKMHAYSHANWMSIYRPKPDRVEADVKVYSHSINPIHTSCDYDCPTYAKDIYRCFC